MKTSNLLLLAALLVLLGTLTAYNMALRAEYRRGTYRDPLREYSSLPLRDFDEVEMLAGSTLNVKIVAGPYAVRVSPRAAKYVQVRQQGRRLVVAAAFEDKKPFLMGEAVVISCPRLLALRTDGVYTEAGRAVAETHAESQHRVLVQGFRQDSLQVQADRASQVLVSDNRLAYLEVTAGRHPGSTTSVQLDDKNHVAAADLCFASRSELILNRVQIPNLRLQAGDSVELSLKGAALPGLLRR